MPLSIIKDFKLKSDEAKLRFEKYESEKGIIIETPDQDPLAEGREILKRKYGDSKRQQ